MECTLWKGGGIVLALGARIPWTLAAGPLQPGDTQLLALRACVGLLTMPEIRLSSLSNEIECSESQHCKD